MEMYEKAKILADLEFGKKVILDAVSGVTEDVAKRIPAQGKWSILECVEHLATSEDYLFAQMASAHPSDVPMVNEEREALIVTRGLDRARTVESPDVGKPSGRYTTLAEAIQQFLAARKSTIRFVESCEEDLRSMITSHPILGTLNCYENLLIIAVHSHRHAKQIEQTKAVVSLGP